MYQNKRILAFIPARGGSKGIPHKNVVDLCGKPLICYTIKAAKKSKYIDYVMISTDDEAIAKVSEESGGCVPFMRPNKMATDQSNTLDAIVYSINKLKENGKEYDILLLLQPTSPLRTAEDIDKAVEMYFRNGCESLVSVSEVDDNPILIRTLIEGRAVPIIDRMSTCRRQEMPRYYRVNGAIYINSIEEINENTSFNDNSISFVMDKRHSVDIDEQKDLVLAEYYLCNYS